MSALDAYKIRQDFAILDQVVNDEPLVYLDNAATTQKPQVVLDTLMAYYHEDNANVHRGFNRSGGSRGYVLPHESWT